MLVGVQTIASELKQDVVHSLLHAAKIQHEVLYHKHLHFPAAESSLTNPQSKNPCWIFVTYPLHYTFFKAQFDCKY